MYYCDEGSDLRLMTLALKLRCFFPRDSRRLRHSREMSNNSKSRVEQPDESAMTRPRETWVPEVLLLVGDPKIHGEPVVLAVEADGASSRPGPRARPHLISAGCDFNGDEDAHTYAHEA